MAQRLLGVAALRFFECTVFTERSPTTLGEPMKLITAIIKPFKLDEVREAL